MTGAIIIVLLALSNVIHAFGTSNSSDLKAQGAEHEKFASRKVKRWATGFQDIAVDYPDFDDSYGDNQVESARPFSTSPGSILFYRPGSRRPSGAVTRTVFNPPSGLIPRVFAAAKAAIATLTGPQTVLSKTTYLSPPRPGITALQVPHGPQAASTEGGPLATNAAAAAAAAAAAVAAVTRSIYEAAGQRANGFYEKQTYLPPSTYNNYGVWPETPRSPWTTLQPPDITFRIPHEPWDRPRPQITGSYGPPSPTWFNQNPIITIENPGNLWAESHFKGSYNGWSDYRNQWSNYDRNHGSWVQENTFKDWADEKRTKNSHGRAGGNGGYAAATADTPPNGDSFADAKVTANGASAVAAAVWDLGGIRGRITGSKRTQTEVYGAADNLGREGDRLGIPRKKQQEEDQFTGRVDDVDLDDKKSDQAKCNDDRGCLPKSNAERLRKLFPSRRKS